MITIAFHVGNPSIPREVLDWSMNVTSVQDVSRAKTIYGCITTGHMPIECASDFDHTTLKTSSGY
jgi:hypothetical protein